MLLIGALLTAIPAVAQTRNIIIAVTAAGLILSMLISYWMTRSIAIPIAHLSAHLVQVGAQNRSSADQIASASNEMGSSISEQPASWRKPVPRWNN